MATTTPGLDKIPLSPTETESVLQGMQKLVDERSGPWSQIMGGLKDASAWTAGGAQGPSAALAERDRQKQLEQQDLLSMQTQMATYRNALAQNEQSKARLQGLMGGTSPIPGVEGTAAQHASIMNDPEVKLQLATVPDWDNLTKEAIIREAAKTKFGFVAKGQSEAASRKQEPTWFSGLNKNIYITPNEKEIYDSTGNLPLTVSDADRAAAKALWSQQRGQSTTPAPTTGGATPAPTTGGATPAPTTGGVSQYNLGNIRPAGKSTGFVQPTDYAQGLQGIDNNLQDYGKKGINTLSGIINSWAPPKDEKGNVINDTPAYIKDVASRLSIDPNQPLDLSNPAIRQAIGTGIMLHEKGPKTIFGAPPAPTAVTAPHPSTLITSAPATSAQAPAAATLPAQRAALQTAAEPQFSGPEERKQFEELQKKKAESLIEINAAEKKRIAEGAGDRYAEMQKNASNAKKMQLAADAIYNIASDPKKAEGLGMAKQGLNINSVLANTIHGLGAVGTLGHMSEKEANDLASRTLKPEVQDARDQLEKHAKDLGIGYAAQVFHGARMGIGLEKMAMESKGIGTEFSAATNKMHSDIIKEGANFALARQALWSQYAAEHGGEKNASFAEFENDPRYINLEDQTRTALAKKYPQIFNATDDTRTDGLKLSHVSSLPSSKFDKYKK